ncbi:MAG TPA: dihydroneopterin aldolase [Trueperaceae bacterium]
MSGTADDLVTVTLEGMEFYAFHGVHDYELERGARFVVDLALRLPPPRRDALAEAADYARVYRLVAAVVTGKRFKLIESVAAAVADAVLDAEPRVVAVRVRVHKPHAPLPGVVRDVHCELERRRA